MLVFRAGAYCAKTCCLYPNVLRFPTVTPPGGGAGKGGGPRPRPARRRRDRSLLRKNLLPSEMSAVLRVSNVRRTWRRCRQRWRRAAAPIPASWGSGLEAPRARCPAPSGPRAAPARPRWRAATSCALDFLVEVSFGCLKGPLVQRRADREQLQRVHAGAPQLAASKTCTGISRTCTTC